MKRLDARDDGLRLVAMCFVESAVEQLFAEFPNVDLDLLDDLLWWQDELEIDGIQASDLPTAIDRAHAVLVGAR